MSDNVLVTLKQCLDESLSELDSVRHLFCKHPGQDFTRIRKISFLEIFRCLIHMESKSFNNEIQDFYGHKSTAPSASAFNQQRDKIDTDAFAFLLHHFNGKCASLCTNLLKGYRIVACDGSDINISRDPLDEETFIQQGEKGYNQLHINAFFDLLNDTYIDLLSQGKRKVHERDAYAKMVDRLEDGIQMILIADRGYESFNTFAHAIRKGIKFVTRMKDIGSNGILSGRGLPDGEFDLTIKTKLTRRHTKETMEHPETYTILPGTTDFDYLDDSIRYYEIEFRAVRFQIADGFICIGTNLPKEEFPLEEIKKLYWLRWGEETSFRELKYTIGALNLHSRRRDFIKQELYMRAILYNFCSIASNHAEIDQKGKNKHDHEVNFSRAVNICRAYLKSGGDADDLMKSMAR
ncbi:MAG: IS4 family transposase, partial [Clostridiales bacterium]|nr:IS4 family transposase [Clostridiales bacterium]